MEKIEFERFEEKEIDHAEGNIRINEGKEVVVEKEWQQFWNSSYSSSKRSTVDTMSVFNYQLLNSIVSSFSSKLNGPLHTIILLVAYIE